MKIKRVADGFQIEVNDVLVTFRASPEHPHGFAGGVLAEDASGACTEVRFHGNHAGGVVCHEPKPCEEKT